MNGERAGVSKVAGRCRADIKRIVKGLRSLIELSPMSWRQVELRLRADGRGVDLSRLFHGKFEPKVRHILDICEVIELDPLELFRLVLPGRQEPSPLLRSVSALFSPGSLGRLSQGTGAEAVADEPEVQAALAAFERAYDALLIALGRQPGGRPEIPGSRTLAQALRRPDGQPDLRSSHR